MGIKGMIGLEIHTYISTREKLFCRCLASREKGLKSNVNICPICTGQPGAKPMAPNLEAVKKSVKIGLMLGCEIEKKLIWERKHYDWPDLPKGYQNTISGGVRGVGLNGEFAGIGIWEMHLEEDPASWTPDSGCVDYNRSGSPLVEIVTAPDFTNSEEVITWIKKLIHSLNYLKAIDSNAGIKVDVNVSIPEKSERVEIKNLNSLGNIKKAIDYELARQEQDGSEKETRRFDELKGKTIKMRGKEGENDYRFIDDPDLKEIVLDDKFIMDLKKSLPPSPEIKLAKMIKEFKISKKDADVLVKNIDIAEFFERIIESKKIKPEFALPWVSVELFRLLNYNKVSLGETDIRVEHFIELLETIRDNKISVLKGKEILKEFYPKSFSVKERIRGEGKISDIEELKKICLQIVKENKKATEDYKSGEKSSFNFLMGQIMKKTNKRADFGLAGKVLREILD